MFTEITGNTDLYAQEAWTPCLIYCRESCSIACAGSMASMDVRVEDLIFIKVEDVTV
jgi:hypothetical protein